MKTISVFCICVLYFLTSPGLYAQGPSKLTLAQAVTTAIENNLVVLQTGLQAQSDEISWKQAKLNRYPVLNASGNNGVSQGRSIDPFTNSYSTQKINYASYGISSNVILFNGFSLKNAVKQNELAYQASVMDLQQAKDNLAIAVTLAYLDVLNNQDLLQQQHYQAELTKRQLERLLILDSSGAVAPYLVSDMKGQLATDQLSIINSENITETARLELFRLMNIPVNKDIVLERSGPENILVKYTADAAAVYQGALERFPQLKSNELRKQSAEKAILVAKGQMFPTLSLNGAASTNYSNAARDEIFINTTEFVSSDFVTVSGNKIPVVKQRDNFSVQKIAYGKQLNNNLATTFNLNLRVPIFNSLQGRNRIKLARISLKNTEIIATAAKTELQRFIEQAYLNMNTAWERYKVLLEQVKAYEESFRAAEIRFNAGLGTSIDYLTAKNNLDRAKSNLISVKYDYLLRTKVMDYYQGRLSL